MKTIYKSIVLEAALLSVALALQAEIQSDGETVTADVQASTLDRLKVTLVSPNVSGARDLVASGNATIDGNEIAVNLENLTFGTHRLVVSARFGTQIRTLYALDISVPQATLPTETQEYEDTVIVVSTYGDGVGGGADPTVYAIDANGNASITKPLNIGTAGEGASVQANRAGAIASGNVNGSGASIVAGSTIPIPIGYGSVASGSVSGENAGIYATNDGAVARGSVNGDGSIIQSSGGGTTAIGGVSGNDASISANGAGAIASGGVSGNRAGIHASGEGAIAIGSADDNDASIQANGSGSIAIGIANETDGNVIATGIASQAFGIGVRATQNAQMVVGKCNVVDTDNSFQFIVGNGTGDTNRRNAFAVTKSGGLALFIDGTPIILDAATLKALVNVSPFMKQVEVFDGDGTTKLFSQSILMNMTWGDVCEVFPDVFYVLDGYVYNAQNHSEGLCSFTTMIQIAVTDRVDVYPSYIFTINM